MVLGRRKQAFWLSLLGMLCSETVGEGVGGSTSACLAAPKCDHKQLNLCQACDCASNYTHLSLGTHFMISVG